MPNISSHNDSNAKNTSSGQGAHGMGGQPDDDPRDLERGGTGRSTSDAGGGTGPIPGAFGGPLGSEPGGGSAGNQTVGPMGDKDAMPELDDAIRKAREQGTT
ncbi:hypothetical protein TA3x_001472 [Tundrisphaera sp. TA3]|uniref:hypothetical protein n=1 Tax=Tundrisphaera sp. TA3 TaxID=3435775 RepID=UPI003EB76F1E